MKRIMFVDDESTILDGLRRLLRVHRSEWEMEFSNSALMALDICEKSPVDVVVSDMRMPGMDGAELLRQMNQRWPQTVRFILSGYADLEATMRAVPVAHQFLSKPCDPAALFEVVNRACELQSLLHSLTLQSTIGKIEVLPPLPGTYATLSQKLSRSDVTTGEISGVIERDPIVCAKLLQIVNSSFFGLPRRINSVTNAINYLGVNMLRNLVLSTEIFGAMSMPLARGFSAEGLQRHVLLAAGISRAMSIDKFKTEDVFMGCMLHDIGKFVFALTMPDQYSTILTQSAGDSILDAEKAICGVTHPEVGAYLLGIWGLPYPIVEAVAHHHDPSTVKHSTFDVVDAVYVSNMLTHEFSGTAGSSGKTLDEAYLASLGVADNLAAWRSKAKELAEAH